MKCPGRIFLVGTVRVGLRGLPSAKPWDSPRKGPAAAKRRNAICRAATFSPLRRGRLYSRECSCFQPWRECPAVN